MASMENILADLIKGASRRGAGIELDQKGHEEKLAGWSGGTAALAAAYAAGHAAASEHLKVAFLGPLMGMAANAAGSTLAGKALGAGANRIGGQVLSNLGGQVAQAGAEHLMTPRQPMMSAGLPYPMAMR